MKCPKCNNHLFIEHELDYSLVCYECDENFFIFEGIEEYESEKEDFYKYMSD